MRQVGRTLALRGHEITVLQPNPGGRPREEICDGITIQRVDAPLGELLYGFDVFLLADLKTAYSAFSPDVVHVQGYHSLFSSEAVYLVCRLDPRVPLIFSFHLDVYRERFLARRLWNVSQKTIGRKMVGALSRVVADSEFEAETISREFGVPRDQISVIPLGVSVVDTRKTPGGDRGPRLLYVGHLVKRKNIQSIVESLHVLVHQKNVRDASLTIVGGGPERESISRVIGERGLEAHVTMKPFLERADLMREIKNAGGFVLLSNSEAYGIAVAEALALGTPCIVTNSTALSEFTREPGCFGVGALLPTLRQWHSSLSTSMNAGFRLGHSATRFGRGTRLVVRVRTSLLPLREAPHVGSWRG